MASRQKMLSQHVLYHTDTGTGTGAWISLYEMSKDASDAPTEAHT